VSTTALAGESVTDVQVATTQGVILNWRAFGG
jgi:hypothetical protein